MTESEPIVATLTITNAKDRLIKVRGRSGKPYAFTKDKGGKGVVRNYTSMVDLRREELDIRQNRNNPYVIVLALGGACPVRSAKDAVEVLVGSVRSLQKPKLLAALTEIQETVGAAIINLEKEPEPEPEVEPVEEVRTVPPPKFLGFQEPKPLPADAPFIPADPDADDPLLYAPPSPPALTVEAQSDAPVVVVAEVPETVIPVSEEIAGSRKYTHAELMDGMKWGAFRKLCTEHGIELTNRQQMADEFIKKQG